jgi:hypothetical protein
MIYWITKWLQMSIETKRVNTDASWHLSSVPTTTIFTSEAQSRTKSCVISLCSRHNDLPWNIRKFLHNRLRDFRFGEDLRKIVPWSSSPWSHTDLPRLQAGLVAAQVSTLYIWKPVVQWCPSLCFCTIAWWSQPLLQQRKLSIDTALSRQHRKQSLHDTPVVSNRMTEWLTNCCCASTARLFFNKVRHGWKQNLQSLDVFNKHLP